MAGYIGARASVVSSGSERKQTYAITTTTTSLTGLAYTPTKVHVYHNGIRLVDGTDYTATDGSSITLTTAAENGDEVVVISYATFQTSDTVSAANGGTFAGNVEHTGTLTASGDLNAGTIKDATGTNTGLTVSSDGLVLTPNRPAFRAYRTSGQAITNTNANKIQYTTTSFDVGGNFDTTNHRFVCPIAGIYMFTSTVNAYGISAGNTLKSIFMKNGSTYQNAGLQYSDSSLDQNVNATIVAEMAVNDYMEVFVQSASDSSYSLSQNEWNTFSGYLIG